MISLKDANEKIYNILKFMQNDYKTLKEIQDYCKKIGEDHQFVWNNLMEGNEPLVENRSFNLPNSTHRETKFRTNKNGLKFIQDYGTSQALRKTNESWLPSRKEITYLVIGSLLTIATTIILKLLGII